MHHAAKLTDLAKSPEAIKKALGPIGVAAAPEVKATAKVYPWCTCISLDHDVLKAMNMVGDLPPVGAEVHGCFVAVVKSVRGPTDRLDEGGAKISDGASVELELHELGFAAEDDVDRQLEQSEQRQKTWYGGKEPDGDEV